MENRNKKGQFLKGSHWREEKLIWSKEWLYEQYVTKQRSMKNISEEINVTEAAVRHWIKKHNIPTRSIKEIRKKKYWGISGSDNPMWNKKGNLNPNWKGGITKERQLFYQSQEWKQVCQYVWKRDKAKCQNCGAFKDDDPSHPFHIHHIISFMNEDMRADPNNLILLCETCHHWVHSKNNTSKLFLS